MKLENFFKYLYATWKSEAGQGLVEYVLIIFLFTIAMAISLSSFTTALSALYTTISAAFP